MKLVRHLRFAAACALAVSLWLGAGTARAAMMVHYDLASLALQADAIVLATRGAQRQVKPYVTATEYHVLRTFAGALRPGMRIEALDGVYRFNPTVLPFPRADAGAPQLSDQVVLFLQPTRDADRRGFPPWSIVPSGMRILLDGKVHRFEQWSNPGPYAPVPQGRDPWDVLGDPTAGGPLTLLQFEPEITRAIQRAAEVRASLADTDQVRAKGRLLELLGPPAEPAGAWSAMQSSGFYADHVARTVIEHLAEQGDLPAVLEAVARSPVGVSWFMLGYRFDEPALLGLAVDPSRPLRHRVAALTLLSGRTFDRSDHGTATLVALMSDDEPAIRAMVPTLRFPSPGPPPAMRQALERRWLLESDPRVQHAILRAATSWDPPLHLGQHGPDLAFIACRQSRLVHFSFAFRGATRWQLRHAVLEALQGGAVVAQHTVVERPDQEGLWYSQTYGGGLAAMAFSPALSTGSYQLRLRATFAAGSGSPVERIADLGTLELADGRQHDPFPEIGDAGPAPAISVIPSPTSAAPGQRGCSCRTPGATPPRPVRGSAWWPVWLVGILSLARRQARRRPAAAPR